jgi:hypothetical protein
MRRIPSVELLALETFQSGEVENEKLRSKNSIQSWKKHSDSYIFL